MAPCRCSTMHVRDPLTPPLLLPVCDLPLVACGHFLSSPFTSRVTNFAEAEVRPHLTYGGDSFTQL